MSNPKINRREAGHLLLSAAAVACLSPGALAAQPFGDKDKDKDKKNQPKGKEPVKATAPTIDMNKLITPAKIHDWTLKGEINVQSWVEQRDLRQSPQVHEFEFTSAHIVFPVLRSSSCHRVYDRELKSELRFNETIMAEKPTELLEGAFPCGTRLGRWDLKAPAGQKLKGREMKLEIDIPMTSWRTTFDEKLAEYVPWPTGRWGPVAASTFTDLQRVGDRALVNHTTEGVQALVKQWCGNKDPKAIGPVALAKWLASNVLEYIQVSGDGLRFADNGLFEGMDIRGSEDALRTRRGTEQDVTCAVAAVYRAAGLPCRTVIGFDVLDDKGGKDSFLKRRRDVPAFRSWVEFCLYDEKTRKEVWVPVDVNRQKKMSSRILNNMKGWQFFGHNDEFDMVCPFAFQFHPPTTVIAHGSIAFWGWLTFGDEAPKGEQYLRFNAITTPKTSGSQDERKKNDEQRPPTNPPRR
jgi:hypothetical protein